jgi:D-glutamate cyclase
VSASPQQPRRDTFEVMAESIETLCTVEMRAIGPGRGVIRPLYEGALAEHGGSPMLSAAHALIEHVQPGSVVILSTGIVIPTFMPHGESDGPPGIAALAMLMAQAFEATPLIICESETAGPQAAACQAIGLPVRTLDEAQQMPAAVAIHDFATEPVAAQLEAASLLDELAPAAVIAAEKLGVNLLGIPHTSTGKLHGGRRNAFEAVVEQARQRGIPTIGIGDNGNEIGFGNIVETVYQHKPFGRHCQDGCEAGLACADRVDHLIVATVSNWGCYGLVGMVAGLLKRPDLIPPGSAALDMLRACVAAGAVDGATGLSTISSDGIPGQVEASFLEMLASTVRMGLTERKPRRF